MQKSPPLEEHRSLLSCRSQSYTHFLVAELREEPPPCVRREHAPSLPNERPPRVESSASEPDIVLYKIQEMGREKCPKHPQTVVCCKQTS